MEGPGDAERALSSRESYALLAKGGIQARQAERRQKQRGGSVVNSAEQVETLVRNRYPLAPWSNTRCADACDVLPIGSRATNGEKE
jgi:hypothetical protein